MTPEEVKQAIKDNQWSNLDHSAERDAINRVIVYEASLTPEDIRKHRQIVRHEERMAFDPDYRAKWLAAVNETDYDTDTWAKEDE